MISREQYIDDLDIKNKKFDIKGIQNNPDLKDRYSRRNQKGRVNDRMFIIGTGIYHFYNTDEAWKNNLEYINDVLTAFGFHKVYPRKPEEVAYYYCLINNLTYIDYQSIVESDTYQNILNESRIIDKREVFDEQEYKKQYQEKYDEGKKKKEDIEEIKKLMKQVNALDEKNQQGKLDEKDQQRLETIKQRLEVLKKERGVDKYFHKSNHITVGWVAKQLSNEQIIKDNEEKTGMFTQNITNEIKKISSLAADSNYKEFLTYLNGEYKRLYTMNYATTTYYFRKNLYEYISDTINRILVAQEESRRIEYTSEMDDYQSEVLNDISAEIYDALLKAPIQGKIEVLKQSREHDSGETFKEIQIKDVRSKIWYDNYGGTELDNRRRKTFQDSEIRFDKAKIDIRELSQQLVDKVGICDGLDDEQEKRKVTNHIYREMLEMLSGRKDVERGFLFFVMVALGKRIDEINNTLAKCGFYIVYESIEDQVLFKIIDGEHVTLSELQSVGLAPGKYAKQNEG